MKFLKLLFFLSVPLALFARQPSFAHSFYPALKPTIIIDAGHGGPNIGAKVKRPLYVEEKRLTLSTALLAKRYLEELGYRVIMTRKKDIFIPLQERVNMANKYHPEIFVSIHFNSCPDNEIRGVEVFYSDASSQRRLRSSKKLAERILSRVLFKTKAQSRGVKRANFLVIRDTKMPAVLVEGGFLTNSEELCLIKDKVYLEKIAKGIAEGIDRFFRF